MMAMSIIPTGAAHAPVLAAVHLACFTDQPWHPPWDQAAMDSILGTPGVTGWLAVADDASAGAPTPIGLLLVQAAVEDADILTLGVCPGPWRRRGVARRLLAEGSAALTDAGVTRLLLEVAETNTGALAFYHAAGFAQVGRRREYFTAGPGPARDALVMARDLIGPRQQKTPAIPG